MHGGYTAYDSAAGDLTSRVTHSEYPLLSGSNAVGTHTVTYSVTDGSQSTSVTRTITIVDSTAPQLSLLGSANPTVERGMTFADNGVNVYDAVYGYSVGYSTSGSVNTNVVGQYVLTYTATDPSQNSASISRTVTVSDTAHPEITIVGSATVTVQANAAYSDQGAHAIDGSDDITSSITIQTTFGASTTSGVNVNTGVPGTYVITYSVVDVVGLQDESQRVVVVVDTVAPVITLSEGCCISVEGAAPWVEPGYSAVDNVAPFDLTSSVTVTGAPVMTATAGSVFYIHYSVTDAYGNYAEETRTVTIVDTTPPVITLSGATQMTWEINTMFEEPGFTATDTLYGTITGSVSRVPEAVDAWQPNAPTAPMDGTQQLGGTTVLTYSVTDPAGNTGYAYRTVQFFDTIPPEQLLTGSGTVMAEGGIPYVDQGASATDNGAPFDLSSLVQTRFYNAEGENAVVDTFAPARGSSASPNGKKIYKCNTDKLWYVAALVLTFVHELLQVPTIPFTTMLLIWRAIKHVQSIGLLLSWTRWTQCSRLAQSQTRKRIFRIRQRLSILLSTNTTGTLPVPSLSRFKD